MPVLICANKQKKLKKKTKSKLKPRSLRFTWSMKTTSSRDPNEIMMEIRKVFTPPPYKKQTNFTPTAVCVAFYLILYFHLVFFVL